MAQTPANLENERATAAILITVAGEAYAEIEVKMLNKGTAGAMVFEPALMRGGPSDTVKFVATDKGVPPAGATPFLGKSGDDVAVTFNRSDVCSVRSLPHWHGHVAMVVVGTPTNPTEAKAIPQVGKANQGMADLFETPQPARPPRSDHKH